MVGLYMNRCRWSHYVGDGGGLQLTTMTSVRLLNSSDLFGASHHLNGTYHSSDRSRTPNNGLEVIETSRTVRVHQEKPHLVSLGGGRLSTSVTIHPLPEGKTRIGRSDAPTLQDIVVQGPGVEAEHCYIQNESGKVTLYPVAKVISIDGMTVTEPSRLHQGCMICIGRSNFFRFNHPEEAQNLKELLPNSRLSASATGFRPVTEPPSRFRGTPSSGAFDPLDNSVDFVEKVSKFEFLAHNRSPPVTSSENQRWFVRDGIRIPAAARFTPTSPRSSSPKSPKSPRVAALSGHGSPLTAGRCTPTSPRLGTGHRVASHEDIRACEVELAQQHRRAVTERLRDQEQERQERQRLEEILTLCAEYERKAHTSTSSSDVKKKNPKESPPSSDSGTEDVTSPPGSGSDSSAPDDSSKTSESSVTSASTEDDSNEKAGLERNDTVRRNKQLPERPNPTKLPVAPTPAASDGLPPLATSKLTNQSGTNFGTGGSSVGAAEVPIVVPTPVHHPNRIKTNGSLAELDGKRAGRLVPDGSGSGDGMLTVVSKKANATSSEDELTNILGVGGSSKLSPRPEKTAPAPSVEKAPMPSVAYPQSPRTRIRTVATVERSPEVYENHHAWKDLAIQQLEEVQLQPPRKLPERGGSLNIRKATEEPRVPLRRARSSSDDVSLMRRQREDSFHQITKLKKDIFSLEAHANEGMRELELEHALITGELTDAQACQKSDYLVLENLQEEERRLAKQAELDREQTTLLPPSISLFERQLRENNSEKKRRATNNENK
ncbi:hypothetical protein IscW_ISCW018206 [Ixodes scapularis]|uniref:FHA domain-containing protein n=1 Tax=Ixodes scapularis TaxID=6945 RepID=B7PFE4_IXOSC|nr:hypothetical protein IscW_ISCW018206 [Ixodes scapularis]|eukprot:XP_002433916.1 hypothetical protein IscW_ISCW018206 [Ixodes scapularis]